MDAHDNTAFNVSVCDCTQCKNFTYKGYCCQPKAALKEALALNLPKELAVLQLINKTILATKFSRGRESLYSGLVDMIRMDPDRADMPYNMTADEKARWDVAIEKIKEGGRLLLSENGYESMTDPLVWSFIPRRLCRDVDMYWDGIGGWSS
jgi:hypothetical protein